MNPAEIVLTAVLGGLVSSVMTVFGTWKLLSWRVRDLEERMEPIDRAEDSVIIRLARLETQRRRTATTH